MKRTFVDRRQEGVLPEDSRFEGPDLRVVVMPGYGYLQTSAATPWGVCFPLVS